MHLTDILCFSTNHHAASLHDERRVVHYKFPHIRSHTSGCQTSPVSITEVQLFRRSSEDFRTCGETVASQGLPFVFPEYLNLWRVSSVSSSCTGGHFRTWCSICTGKYKDVDVFTSVFPFMHILASAFLVLCLTFWRVLAPVKGCIAKCVALFEIRERLWIF